MRTFLFGIMLGAIAGVMYAPATGTRTRSLIKDKYGAYSTGAVDFIDRTKEQVRGTVDEVSMLVQENAGPLKERAIGLRDDMKTRISEVRGMVEEKVGEMKEQLKSETEDSEGQDQFRRSA